MNWIHLEEIEELDFIDQLSETKSIIIFKHSTQCPVSFAALGRLEAEELIDIEYDAYYLDLIRYRSISNEIAQKYQVTHQSPQIIVIKKGKAIYHNSHMGVSIRNLKNALI